MQKERHFEIQEFGSDEYTYWVDFTNLVWSLIVSRNGGSILFIKSSIHEDNFDSFATKCSNGKTEVYINTTDDYGSHCDYVGETENHEAAENWITAVNQFYENRRKNKASENKIIDSHQQRLYSPASGGIFRQSG